MIDILSLRLN